MKFSELINKWENGWTGKARFCDEVVEFDSTGVNFTRKMEGLLLTSDWKIIPEPKPVPFMDAVKAYSEGKTIRCEWGGDVYRYTGDRMIDHRADAVCPDEILHGTWTIEA
jgi:hypothetical protein